MAWTSSLEVPLLDFHNKAVMSTSKVEMPVRPSKFRRKSEETLKAMSLVGPSSRNETFTVKVPIIGKVLPKLQRSAYDPFASLVIPT